MTVTTTPTAFSATKRLASTVPLRALVRQAIRVRLALAASIGTLMVMMGLMVGALWPSMEGALAEFSDAMPEAFRVLLAGADLASPIGWANAEMMSLTAPAGAIVIGVMSAGRATAGEEDAKILGLVLSAPVSRTTMLVSKAIGMLVHVIVVCAMIAFGLLVGSAVGAMDLPASAVLATSTHTGFLGVLFGTVALAAGAGGASRRLTSAITGALAAFAFAAASFLPLNESLAPLAKASPWYYFNASDPLSNGADLTHLAVLGGASLFFLAVAVTLFRRRDLRG